MKKILLISLLLSCKLFSSATFDIFAYALQNNLKPLAISIFKHIDQQDQELAQRTFARKYLGEDVEALAAARTSATTSPVGQLPAELTAAMNAAGDDSEKALAGFQFIMTSPAGSGKVVIDKLKTVGKEREVAAILDGAKS